MKISFRDVTSKDSQLILQWRNDRQVREYSSNPKLIGEETHHEWFLKRMARSSSEPWLIFVIGEQEIGMTRLDIAVKSPNMFEISIVLAPEFRGLGYSSFLIQQTISVASERLEIKKIIANVHKNNYASIKLFETCNFKREGIYENFYKYERFLSV
jgi:RimJ/RimL family protein N-acetyltransferase